MEAEPNYRWLGATYRTERILEEVSAPCPFHSNLYRSTFLIKDFPFCNRLEMYAIVEPGERALIMDTGHPDLCGRASLDGIVAKLGVPWERMKVFISHFHDDHDGNLRYCMLQGAQCGYSPAPPDDPHGMADDFLRAAASTDLRSRELYLYTDLVGGGKPVIAETRGFRTILHGGEVLEIGGYSLEVLPTPGHTDNHLCLIDRGKKVLFAGDHIVDAPPGHMQFGVNQHLLKRYLASLAELKALGLNTIYMCHHEPLEGSGAIADFISVIEGRYDSLACKTERLFDSGEPLTVRQAAYAVADHYPKGLDGFPRSTQCKRIAMVFGSLEYLYDVGFLSRSYNDEGALVYSRVKR